MASKLRNRQEKVLQEDTTAAENQAADIFEKCQLTHPIAYDSFNLCALIFNPNGLTYPRSYPRF